MRPDVNYYLNWALYAITGGMAEADDIMRRHGHGVRAVAGYLRARMPPPRRTLYRGLLLEPHEVGPGFLAMDPRFTFVSFSEDLRVACWFADPRSIMSSYVAQRRPRVRGYVGQRTPDPSEILFHYGWNRALNLDQMRHPHLDPEQLAWNLRTQSEVILEPLRLLPIQPREFFACPPTAELDARLTIPRFR